MKGIDAAHALHAAYDLMDHPYHCGIGPGSNSAGILPERRRKPEQDFTDPREYLVGGRFTAADVLVGSTVQWSLFRGLLPKTPALTAYADRLAAPANQKAFAGTLSAPPPR